MKDITRSDQEQHLTPAKWVCVGKCDENLYMCVRVCVERLSNLEDHHPSK